MQNKAYATSTAQIISKMENTDNPVTRSSYRVILGNRIDRAESFRLATLKRMKKLDEIIELQGAAINKLNEALRGIE